MEEQNTGSGLCLSGTAADGFLRVIGAETTALAETARQIHTTSPTATAALGRVLTGAVLLSNEMKNDRDRLTVQVKGRGPAGGITAVSRIATRGGTAGDLEHIYVKGYMDNPYADLPLREADGKLDVGALVGKGYLHITMDLGLKEPYTGSVPLLSGEIAEDLSYYYASSKQIPAAVSLGVLIGEDLRVLAAGGFLLQLLPGAPEELITAMEQRISGMPSVTTLLRAGATIGNILEDVTQGYNLLLSGKMSCAYACDCSRERMKQALCSIGREELRQISEEDHGAELCCHFCNQKYIFSEKEIANLL